MVELDLREEITKVVKAYTGKNPAILVELIMQTIEKVHDDNYYCPVCNSDPYAGWGDDL